ncbi:SWIM zinc finger family protein [Streptomyces sp. NPDC042638]|uniref:SWIM zinc finger family protein n=1 Tax=Streptomyces sp. NPDC042638 TaxID=3154333 RepID=UPI003403721A
MTGTGGPRPGDAARRALRAARERAEAEREGPARATDEGVPAAPAGSPRAPADAGTDVPDSTDPRPGDVARAALRGTPKDAGPAPEAAPGATPPAPDAAVEAGPGPRSTAPNPPRTARETPGAGMSAGTPAGAEPGRARGDGAVGEGGPDGGGADDARPGGGDGVGAGRGGVGGARPAGAGGDDAPAGGAGSSSTEGRRPGDAARQALRAARREASRAQAAEPRGRERRTSAPTGPAAPRPSAVAGPVGADARVTAAQDIRRYLATAFRMPTWAEVPGDPDDPEWAEAGGEPEDAARATPASTEPTPVTPAPSPSVSASTPSPGEPSPELPATAPSAPAPGAPAAPPAPAPAASAEPSPELPPTAPLPEAVTPDARAAVRTGSAGSYVPQAMAAPHRDSELRRTFPAFVARDSGGAGGQFAGTWWGNAWVGALERGALDPKRLTRGRGYADQGHVDAITVTPGLVLAYVRGSRPRPYRVQVRVRTLEDEDWERFLDAAADRPGHIAALLDKELPHSLADCGVRLLPGPGDLAPQCSCPDFGHPCKHAAALCYQMARLLDADPFVLLLLRGRGEKELLDTLSRRSAARAARAARERQPRTLPGVRAAETLAPRELPRLPPPLPVPPHPGQPPVYPSVPGGPDPFALDQLATDAAARAHVLLGTGHDPVGELTLWQDAVRLAAARPGSGLTAATRTLYARLADAAGRAPADLARAVAAWRQGGLPGLAVLEEPWDPPAGRFDRARPLLLAADLPAFRPWRNRLTHPRGHVQLRLGRDGLWYAYESEPGHDDWWPRGTPDLDPVGALTGLGVPDDL